MSITNPTSLLVTKIILLIVLIVSPVESFSIMTGVSSNNSLQQHTTFCMSGGDGSSVVVVDELMLETYDKLATRLMKRYEEGIESNNLRNNQLFVCVAGGPGSGKSTLCAAVVQRINDILLKDDSSSPAVVLPMDGYHYSRAQLKSMGESPDIEYTHDELLARRGAPWTFDAESCITAFTQARNNGKATLPIYSRTKSDPVENGVTLHPTTKIVLLEGNYLLAFDDERWNPLQTNNVFDETWYIACKSIEDQRERLVKRHLETWSDEKTKMFGEGVVGGAGNKADANDMLNLIWIEEKSRHHADYVIESL